MERYVAPATVSEEVLRTLALPSHPGKKLPYQSIYKNGKMLMRGERTDLLERHHLIPWDDLEGKSVLDIGCNIGAASLLAMESGAGLVTGIDRSEACVTAAQEIAGMLGRRHDFRVMDASKPEGLGRYDTGFAFSVLRHVDARPAMRLCTAVFCEVNVRDHDLPQDVLEEWKPELLGHVGSRKFYRLEKR